MVEKILADKILDGRVAVVTGASRGIGRAAALALASAGA
ncbi:short-chain dehydrogenase/reductase SDR, partial [Methylorubrum extorquens DSM 13060]